ncbi:glycosyltransferase 87 family protein [Verrucosispora sp. FIM060022]|uniref:glycosyltransferase 87 family protein n=1 Tax=Verrucosispora sp. FIM060022 TaxID=1479020 RepID=UPI000F884A59|nr:glycosyltransferase 87 family protein [Verrucosispora sp. FIM060022]RUL92724.1 DUF2029 domain-containing protein [Verrucosispora sp. FIM060022]
MLDRMAKLSGGPATGFGRILVPLMWVAVFVAAAAQAWAGLSRPWADRLSDLQVYIGGVRTWLAGDSLYDFAAAGTGAPFTYPPLAGLLFLPLGHLNTTAVMVGWTILTVAAVVAIAKITAGAAARTWGLRKKVAVPAVALLLFLSAPVSSNLRFGQISIFLVLFVLVDAVKVVPERYRGVATGLAAALKLTPLIFIPYLWLAGQRAAAVKALGTFVVATLLGWLVLFDESVRYWTKELLDVERVGNIATGGNQSLNGALLRLDLPDSIRSGTVLLLGGVIVVIALVRATRLSRRENLLAATLIVGAAGLVFSPVSWTHHQVWLVLAAVLPISVAVWKRRAWAVLVAIVMIAPVTSIGAGLPGGVVWGNARLVLAVAIACLVPFIGRERGDDAQPGGETNPTDESGAVPGQRPVGSQTLSR